jgi:hypothetical protein
VVVVWVVVAIVRFSLGSGDEVQKLVAET